MAESSVIFSSYSLNFSYWIIFEGAPFDPLVKAGAKSLHHQPNMMGLQVGANWVDKWDTIIASFEELPKSMAVRATVIPADELPSLQEIGLSLKPWQEVEAVAKNIWLSNYLSEGRLVCFMQPVVNRARKTIGYEAFARIDAPDGTLINGGSIMQASQALRMEYQVDRAMHQQAVQSYIHLELEGVLFINFLTGFIHLPEIYLSGLSQAAEGYQLPSQTIALDVPLGSYGSDLPKLKSIAQYCQAQGFAMALDDVAETAGLSQLLEEIQPAYIKLDATLGAAVTTTEGLQQVKEIIRRAHAFGAKVVAEAVETEEQFQAYLAAEVDLFQGYLFGAPTRNIAKS